MESEPGCASGESGTKYGRYRVEKATASAAVPPLSITKNDAQPKNATDSRKKCSVAG